MATTNATLAQRIAHYAISLTYADLTPQAIHAAKQRLVESIGCALGACEAQPVVNARNLSTIYSSNASTILGTTRQTTPDMAAFVNSTMVRCSNSNDDSIVNELAHPGDTIPACIAVAEAEGASGKDLILAIVLAYEIQCRFVEEANRSKRGWDDVKYVLIAVVVAAAKLVDLDDREMTEAIKIAIDGHIDFRQLRAGGLSAGRVSSAANAARNAIFAAQAARYGMEGPSPIFEGDMGFTKQITGLFELGPETFGNGVNKVFIICRPLNECFATQRAQVTATLKAGEVLNEQPHHMVGGLQEPTTDEAFEAKYRKLVEPYLPRERREKLLEKLWNVEREERLAKLLGMMVIEETAEAGI